MDATVLTIPRSGTHFLMYFLLVELDIDARYAHVRPRNEDRLIGFLESADHMVIATVPDLDAVKLSLYPEGDRNGEQWIDRCESSRERLQPMLAAAGALPFTVQKFGGSEEQLKAIASASGVPWKPKYDQFVQEWPHLGIGQSGGRMNALRARMSNARRFLRGNS